MTTLHDKRLVGIFIGGKSLRMGTPKALLPALDAPLSLAERAVRLAQASCAQPVLVGAGEVGAALSGVPRVQDEPARVGPLGGLCALLSYAGSTPVIALACDMPHVTAALLQRLAEHASHAPVVAPRDPLSGKWQPLFARYEPPLVLPALRQLLAAGERSFQALLRALPTEELTLSPEDQALLRDWDTPEDVARDS